MQKEPELELLTEWKTRDRLAKEKEVLNFYVSGHPLNDFLPFVGPLSTIELNDYGNKMIDQDLRICGMITDIQKKMDKRNKTFAIIKFEDLKGKAECIFWSDKLNKYNDHITEDNVLVVIGKSELANDMIKMIASEVYTLEQAVKKFAKGYKIWIDVNEDFDSLLDQMKNDACNPKKSVAKIIFNIFDKESNLRKMYIAENVKIGVDLETTKKLTRIFGNKSVSILT